MISFCNSAQLVHLILKSEGGDWDPRIFREVAIPSLKVFTLEGNLRQVQLPDFLARHADTLEELTLVLKLIQDDSSAYLNHEVRPPYSFHWQFPRHSLHHCSFKKLRCLSAHPVTIPWFLNSISEGCEQRKETPCLPGLQSIAILMSDWYYMTDCKQYSEQLDQVFEAISKVINFNREAIHSICSSSASPVDLQPNSSWLSQLKIVDSAPLNKSYALYLFIWMTNYFYTNRAVPPGYFDTIEDLHLDSPNPEGGFCDDLIQTLPLFCSLFPKLKTLRIDGSSGDVTKLDGAFWERLALSLPNLQSVQLRGRTFSPQELMEKGWKVDD